MIRDASFHIARGAWPLGKPLAEASPVLFWQAPTSLAEALNAPLAPKSEAIAVYVNEGRWVVACPDCGGAQLAARDDHRFMCNECANVAIGGRWRPTIWPRQAAAIEEVLDARPSRNQHWLPGESVAQLRLENAAHNAQEA